MLNNIFNIIFIPEIFLALLSFICLLFGLFIQKNSFRQTSNFAVIILFITIVLVYLDNYSNFADYYNLFSNSSFISFFKILVLLGSIATIIISKDYFIAIKLKNFEIPILLLFSTLGMMLMISSNHLMSMYLAIELQSLSLYVAAAIKRDSITSAESGVKYFILGALSSGILLYGFSLIYGFTGSMNFNEINLYLLNIDNLNLGLIFGLVFVLVGLAFKVSAVPFHMWTPDVYEGAPNSVTAFFAIVPKTAAIALIYRFCLVPFENFYLEWSQIIFFLSIASMFLGAIAAIAQTNIKRLLAYSSIGHVGYILIALVAANDDGIKAASIYMFSYMVMNIAIFAIILSIKIKNEYLLNIYDLKGLSKSNPIVSLCIAVIMLSMAGIPPFIGFFGKFYVFTAAIKQELYLLSILGVLASVISAFYYLRIIKIMYFDEIFEENNIYFKISIQAKIILFMSLFIIICFIFYPSLLINFSANLIL
ncbi:MAG: NADH-quinone oxidoreductase subunit N [Pelagibacteraceae bacterium TMED237]|nr:MAG: NADH-quinone oxidoreductase subunit N [Pelagibacteraceae bacterium TMED237]